MKQVILLSMFCLGIIACTGEQTSKDDHADHHHDHHHDHGHVHHAPHGGKLIEVGAHQANLEVLFDTKTGQVDVYMLGPHAERSLRLTDERVPVQFTIGEEVIDNELVAQASKLSGESVGDTSHFQVIEERLIGKSNVTIVVPKLKLLGHMFENISAPIP